MERSINMRLGKHLRNCSTVDKKAIQLSKVTADITRLCRFGTHGHLFVMEKTPHSRGGDGRAGTRFPVCEVCFAWFGVIDFVLPPALTGTKNSLMQTRED